MRQIYYDAKEKIYSTDRQEIASQETLKYLIGQILRQVRPSLERVAWVAGHPSVSDNGWQPPVNFRPKSQL